METTEEILATSSECQKAVQEIFTPSFHAQLVKYSIYRINFKFNIRYDINRGFRGIMVEDIIGELMLSFIKEDGGRNWYKKKFPNFKDQIFSALDSQIFNTITKTFDQEEQFKEFQEDQARFKEKEEEEEDYEELLAYCLDYLQELGASDEELLLFEPFIIHNMKRADIAKEFGITEQDVTNIKKKLERKILLLRKQLNILHNEKKVNQ